MTQLAPLKHLVLTCAAALLTPQFASAQMLTEEDKGLDFPPLVQSPLVSINETLSPENEICQDYQSAMHASILPNAKWTRLSDNSKYQHMTINTSHPSQPLSNEDALLKNLRYRETNIGTFMQPSEGPIFFYVSYLGSWRGNGGSVYASKSNVWDELPWEAFDETDLGRNKKPLPPSLPSSFSLLKDGFVGPNMDVYWTDKSEVVLRHILDYPAAHLENEFQPLHEIVSGGDALKLAPLCEPKSDKSNLKQSAYPHLSAFLGTLKQIAGPAVPSGTLGSSHRQYGWARLAERAAWATPWKIGGGYNSPETTAFHLKHWSYGDAWARWKYLNLIEEFEPAVEDMYWLIANHYGEAPEALEVLAEQTINSLIRAHFIFPSSQRIYYFDNEEFERLIADIFEQKVDKVGFEKALKLAHDLDNKANARPHFSYVHRLITSSFHSPKLMPHVLKSGEALEAKNRYGKTPLMVAAHIGNKDAVRGLIAANVDVSAELNDNIETRYYYNSQLKPQPRSALIRLGGQTE